MDGFLRSFLCLNRPTINLILIEFLRRRSKWLLRKVPSITKLAKRQGGKEAWQIPVASYPAWLDLLCFARNLPIQTDTAQLEFPPPPWRNCFKSWGCESSHSSNRRGMDERKTFGTAIPPHPRSELRSPEGTFFQFWRYRIGCWKPDKGWNMGGERRGS